MQDRQGHLDDPRPWSIAPAGGYEVLVSTPGREASDVTMVGLGLAAACAAHGVRAITADPRRLRLAFSEAWQGWSGTPGFPQVGGSDILAILQSSESRRTQSVAAWRRAGGGW